LAIAKAEMPQINFRFSEVGIASKAIEDVEGAEFPTSMRCWWTLE
jgi:hypothetical protein